MIEAEKAEVYRIRGNYFVREGHPREEGTHYVEGYLIGVSPTTEGGYAVHLAEGTAEEAPRRVVHLRAPEAAPVLRSLYALVSSKRYRAKIFGLRIDYGKVTPAVYYLTKYGRTYTVPKITPFMEAALFTEGINNNLYPFNTSAVWKKGAPPKTW